MQLCVCVQKWSLHLYLLFLFSICTNLSCVTMSLLLKEHSGRHTTASMKRVSISIIINQNGHKNLLHIVA